MPALGTQSTELAGSGFFPSSGAGEGSCLLSLCLPAVLHPDDLLAWELLAITPQELGAPSCWGCADMAGKRRLWSQSACGSAWPRLGQQILKGKTWALQGPQSYMGQVALPTLWHTQ